MIDSRSIACLFYAAYHSLITYVRAQTHQTVLWFLFATKVLQISGILVLFVATALLDVIVSFRPPLVDCIENCILFQRNE